MTRQNRPLWKKAHPPLAVRDKAEDHKITFNFFYGVSNFFNIRQSSRKANPVDKLVNNLK